MRRWVVACVLLSACGGAKPGAARPALPSVEDVRAELAGLGFEAFVELSFERLLQRSPETVVELGLDARIDVGHEVLDDISEEHVAGTQALESAILEMLRGRERAPPFEVTHDAYAWYLDDRVRDQPFADLVYRVTPALNSVVAGTELFFTEVHRLESAEDGEAYVARLWDVARKLGQLEATLVRLEGKGVLTPRILISAARRGVRDIAEARDPRTTPYYLGLSSRMSGAILDRAAEAIGESVVPAYRSLDVLLERLEREAPEAIGVSQLPGGASYYAQTLRHHTTVEVGADELHRLGMTELERIHGDLRARFERLGYPAGAGLSEQIARVAADGGSVPGDRIVAEYEAIVARAESRLDAAFDLRPSARVVVKGGPTGGFYIEPSLDGTRPGAFYAAANGPSEPRFEMPTLAYHEAVPGHHLQIGIAQDLDLPLFQRVGGFNGYVEGWGLYAEWLAADLGWYQDDPYGDIGRLQAEALRAARLVIDTGIHAQGWSFAQAVDFLVENVGYPRSAAEGQVLRYASWPGQATAYWTGRTRIRALRATAEQSPGFDLRAFHRAVLVHGALPLEVLAQVVNR